MKKKVVIIALALAGYAGTTEPFGLTAAVVMAKKSSSNNAKLMAQGQKTKQKHGKKQKLVSDNPSIASVKQIDEKTSHITAHRTGKVFIAIKNKDNDSFIKGFEKGLKEGNKTKRKGFVVNVAGPLPSYVTIKEGEAKFYKINNEDEFYQDNKNNDEAASVSTKHIKLKGHDGTKYKALKIKGIDDGKDNAILLNKNGKKMTKVKVEEKDDNEDDD